MKTDPLLDLKDVSISFHTSMGIVKAADRISFELKSGETMCLIGESGSGKSVVALSILGLLPKNAVVEGNILYQGEDLLLMPPFQRQKIRGRQIAMIFEQPMSCLNPVMKVGEQISETIRANHGLTSSAACKEAKRKMDEVGLSSRRFCDYPHELSGGMQQRVMIAMALACNPLLLIADEPTTSLDLTVQRQILDLLNRLKQRYQTSLLIITHDLGVAAEMSDAVGVMYAGTLMEYSPVYDFFDHPGHPYSRALLNVISENNLLPIKGNVPNLAKLPTGCPFHLRCDQVQDICRLKKPGPVYNNLRMERCHFAGFDSGSTSYQSLRA